MQRKKIWRKVVDGRLVKLTKAQVRKAVEEEAWRNSFEEGHFLRYYGADFYVTDQVEDALITNVTP